MQISDTVGALAHKEDAIGGGVRDDGQVRPLPRLIQIAARRAGAPAVGGHGTVHRAEAFLLIAVQIVGARIASLHTRFDHRAE